MCRLTAVAAIATVVKGNAFVTVGIGSLNDEKATLEKAKMLPRKILAKL